jgi:ribosomal protein S14
MLKLIRKNNKVKGKYKLIALNSFVLRFLTIHLEGDQNLLSSSKFFKNLRKNSSISMTKYRAHCFLTNRTYGNIRLFRLSRIKVKELA